MKALLQYSLTTIIALGANYNMYGYTSEDSTKIDVNPLEDVIVTGQYSPQSLQNAVFKVRVINKEKIEAKAATNVQQILNTELGFRYNHDLALGTADVEMMGMSGRNIKILIDGVPVLDRGDIRESLNQIDPTQIERIEIVEGPMSINYGSDALAGVINIITKKPGSSSLSITARIQEESMAKDYHPFNNKGIHAQFLSLQFNHKKWSFLANLNHTDNAGFNSDAYNRNHTWKPKKQWTTAIKIGYQTPNWQISYRPDFLYETIKTLAPINLDNLKGSNQYFHTSRLSHQVHNHWKINNKWSLNSTLSHTNYERNTETNIINFANAQKTKSTAPGHQDRAFFIATNFLNTVQYNISDKLTLQPGIEMNYGKAGGERIEGNPQRYDYSVFLSTEYKPSKAWNIRPGLRLTRNSLYENPPLIPAVNVLYKMNENISFRAAAAKGYRAPSLRELHFNFVDANHQIKGNPDLKAEYSNSFNASVLYTKALRNGWALKSELGMFYNEFSNLISIASNPADPNEYIHVNIDNHKTSGIEWKNKFFNENIQIGIGGLLLGQYNRLSAYDHQVPNLSWTPELNFEIQYTFQKTATTISLFYKYGGKRPGFYSVMNAAGNIQIQKSFIEAHHYSDLSIRQRIIKHGFINAGVRNLFNVTRLSNNGVNTGGAHSSGSFINFNYGRSYFISLQYQFYKPQKNN